MRFFVVGVSLGVALGALACGSERSDDDGAGGDDPPWSPSLGGAGAGGAANGGSANANASGGSATSGAANGGSNAGRGGTTTGGSAGTASGGSANNAGSGGLASSVTWSEHVAPLVFRECVGCHRDGGIAPFSLTTYADAAHNAAAIVDATAVRYMPPMPVDNSGDCNTYSNARWLTDAEIALLAAWSDAGAPEGDPTRTPELPPAPSGLPRVDVTLDAGTPYTPNASTANDYRCFVVDPGLTSDAFLIGYEVVPGDPRIVHHVIVYGPDDDDAADEAEALDADEPGLGYTCFGASGVSATPLALWAPGGGTIQLPANTGLPMASGRKVIMQVHYNVAGGTFPDRTTVRLQTASSVSKPAAFLPIANTSLNVAAGQTLGISLRTFDLNDPLPVIVHGVLPHMHTLGRTLELNASDGGPDRCLVNVDRWDFNWQNAWWYDTPLTTTLSSLTLQCGYDTTRRTEPVTWGEGTEDEMCLAYLYITAQ